MSNTTKTLLWLAAGAVVVFVVVRTISGSSKVAAVAAVPGVPPL